MMNFPTNPEAIQKRLDLISPKAYAQTRNFTDGSVTYLSPYISRGVISTRTIWEVLKKRQYTWHDVEKLVQELAWRDYFQQLARERDVNLEIKQPQIGVKSLGVPQAIVKAQTGIQAIDQAVETMYQTGYMHNHCRMYIASLACNLAGCHWKNPAQWMYFHLIDGDWASNACSWQWVAGSNSSKKYYANQENINKFTKTTQSNTFLDLPTDSISQQPTPEVLSHCPEWSAGRSLPDYPAPSLDESLPLCIYTPYNLDPNWRSTLKANRILLLDTQHYSQYPVHPKVIDFITDLAAHIEGIQVFTGSFEELMKLYRGTETYYKEHPLFRHFQGYEDSRDWLTPQLTGYYPSFFNYWKKSEKLLKEEFYS